MRPPAQPSVLIVSLGCAKNLVDTEVMCGQLASAGFVLTNVPEAADIVLLNTCSFIADARSEAESEIRQALQWKRRRRGRRVVVAGCLPQRNLRQVREAFHDVDLFLGLDDVPRVADHLTSVLSGGRSRHAPQADAYASPTYLYDHTTPRLQLTPANFAYVKIAEGCDHRCRFCSIPDIRGRQRSRSLHSILAESRTLLQNGVRELNLIAQDTTRYGREHDDRATIESLLRACDELDGAFWLRLLYTHPRYFSDDLMAIFAGARHLVPYVDIPLQHISGRVLEAMGRGMDGAQTRALMERLRRVVPNVAIRTTFLVGYPGETEEDFAELLDYVRDYGFERLGVFAFSPEEGTPAARIAENLVPPELAGERRDRLMELQQGLSLARNRKLVGQTLTVLVEAEAEDGTFIGRTAADAPDVDNCVIFTGPHDCLERGFVDVNITTAEAYELHGSPA